MQKISDIIIFRQIGHSKLKTSKFFYIEGIRLSIYSLQKN